MYLLKLQDVNNLGYFQINPLNHGGAGAQEFHGEEYGDCPSGLQNQTK
jgi:hypothetical protein